MELLMLSINKFSLFSFILLLGFITSATSNINWVNKQIEANNYVQKAILSAWYTKRNSPYYPPNYTEQLDYFKKAEDTDPTNIRLGFYLASTYMLQNKTNQAITLYKKLITEFPRSFNAGIQYAIYNKVIGNNEEYNAEIKKLSIISPVKTRNYLKLIKQTLKIAKMGFSNKATKIDVPKLGAIILGAGLTSEGQPPQIMLNRLKKLFALYQLNNNIVIIVTGGVAQNGVTEAYVMKQWLVSEGIPGKQIYIEDRARDTVENAYYSLKIASQLNFENIVLVTSGSHMRRAYSLFLEMIKHDKLNIKLSGLPTTEVKPDKNIQTITATELTAIFRDTLRASGIWLYPALRL